MRSRISLVLGLILAVGAFVALFVVGQLVNPSPYRVVVVVREAAAGTALRSDMVATDAQSVSPKVASEYVLEQDLDQYLGATIVSSLHPGQPLMHAHLVRAGNPAADNHLSLLLEDESMAAMVIPVDARKAPQNLRPGDRVDFLYAVGRVQTQNAPVPTPPSHSAGAVASEVTTPTVGSPERADAPATPLPEFQFPVAKAVVRNMEILDTVHDEQPNPAYGGPNSSEPPTVQGELKAIQVAVPRKKTEILHYAITTGDYQIAVLSPNAPRPEHDSPTLGMTWEDLRAFFWKERGLALEVVTHTARLDGPGAAALVTTPDGTSVLSTPETDPTATTTPGPGPRQGGATSSPASGTSLTGADESASPTPAQAVADADGSEPSTETPLHIGEGIAAGALGRGLACLGGLLLVVLVGLAAASVLRGRDRS